MAKSHSIFKLQGSIAGLTFVRSSAYGDHVRARRGTHKPARVNSVLRKEGSLVLQANTPAKVFKDAIDPYRGDFLRGTFWVRLVSLFRHQLKNHGKFDFSKMGQIEIHENYPLDGFFQLNATVTAEPDASKLLVHLVYSNHPKFPKAKVIDGYKFTVIGVFPDLKKKTAKTASVISKTLPLIGPVTPLQFELDVPPQSKDYVLCIKLSGCIRGVEANMRTATAMCVVHSGTCFPSSKRVQHKISAPTFDDHSC